MKISDELRNRIGNIPHGCQWYSDREQAYLQAAELLRESLPERSDEEIAQFLNVLYEVACDNNAQHVKAITAV